MKVLFKPKIDYTPNLGIIVPGYYPYNLISYFSWFSFAKNLPNIKKIKNKKYSWYPPNKKKFVDK